MFQLTLSYWSKTKVNHVNGAVSPLVHIYCQPPTSHRRGGESILRKFTTLRKETLAQWKVGWLLYDPSVSSSWSLKDLNDTLDPALYLVSLHIIPSKSCYGLSCVPSKTPVEALTLNVTVFGDGITRSYGWNPNPTGPLLDCPIGSFSWKRIKCTWAQRKGHLRIQGKGGYPRAKREDSGEAKSAHTLILDFQSPGLWENKFLLLKPFNLCCFVITVLADQCTSHIIFLLGRKSRCLYYQWGIEVSVMEANEPGSCPELYKVYQTVSPLRKLTLHVKWSILPGEEWLY